MAHRIHPRPPITAGERGFIPRKEQPGKDIIGQRFGLVEVTAPAPSTGRGARWWVRCECGVERIMLGTHLRSSPPETHKACRAAQRRSA